MKKILFICAFLISGLVVNAQTADKKAKPEASVKAKRMTETMAQKLVLTPEQKPKVLAINLARTQAIEALVATGNKASFEADKKKVVEKWNKDLSVVLTKAQLTKLNSMQNMRNANNQQK